MFCDLVGSTQLSARLDPEDLRRVINGYLAAITRAIQQHGGFVARFLGDGALVYFGWPKADETDAERAVRAALAVITAVGQTASDNGALQVRIGVATGLVVVGDLLGTGAAQENAVIGQTPNLAARLQAVSAPNTVVVDATTYQLIAGLFDCRNLGNFDLRGFPGPIPGWRVLGEIPGQSRFEARHAAGMGPLVDREEDLDMLLRRWREVADGEGRAILISGEAGMGKSRLMAAFEAAVTAEPHVSLRYFCSPHHQESALYPVICRWEQEAGFLPGDTPGVKIDKLEALTGRFGVTGEEMSLLSEMLQIPFGPRYPTLEMSPQRKKEQTFHMLRRLLGVRAQQLPVLILCEDAHWADPSSIELLDKVIDALATTRVLLLITYRPEFQPPWIGREGVSQWLIHRLHRGYAARLAQQVLEGHALPSGLLDRIVLQTDGVPLFIEELTKALIEALTRSEAVGDSLGIPATLQASLLARLDRLPAAKRIAQVGAVIGRDFTHMLLQPSAEIDEAELNLGIEQLISAGLIFRRGAGSEAVYSFKHALVQDAAYGSLLRSTRRDIHARVANALECQSSELTPEVPEVLALHCAEAGRIEDAIRYYRRAAQNTSDRGAIAEAEKHLTRALGLVAGLSESIQTLPITAGLQLELGAFYTTTGLPGHPKATNMFALAVDTCRRLGDPGLLVQALWGHWNSLIHTNGPQATLCLAEELQGLETLQTDPQLAILAVSAPVINLTVMGNGQDAQARSQKALTTMGIRRQSVATFAVAEPEVILRVSLGLAHIMCGEFSRGTIQIETALAVANRLKHLPSILIALTFGLHRLWLLGDETQLRERAHELIALCAAQDVPVRAARAYGYLEWLDRKATQTPAPAQTLKRFLQYGIILWSPCILLKIADIYDSTGDHQSALGHIDTGLETARGTGEIWLEPELLRRRSLVLRSMNASTADVEQHLRLALKLAQERRSRLFELRTAVSLARFCIEQGRGTEALELLLPVENGFMNETITPDIEAAMILLNELKDSRHQSS